MNKTYSVIWSEVRHAYIVVSEYARKGYAKAAMAALAAAVVVSTGMPAALAAAPPAVNAATVSGTDNVVTLRDGTTASDVNQAFELVYTHSDQIEANANNIATNKADIATNTKTIATNTSAIATNTNTIATNTSAIADNKAAIETNTADIATNKSDIAANKAAIATNTANIATNTGAIATNAGNISKLNSEIVNTNTVLGEVSKNLSALNTAVVDGFNTLNAEDAALHTEIKEEADARQAADEKEAATRAAADTALNGAVNGGLSLDDNGVLQKVTTSVNTDGEIGWNKEAATQLVLNKGGENQITLSENGIKVGLNSTVQDANGFYAGGDTAAAAKAALNADGSIKGADGKFTVDTAGNVATKGGSIKTNGGVIQTGGGNINTQGGELRTKGGNINAGAGTVKGATLTDGTATITNGNINTTGTITGGTVTSTGNISALGDINANGALTGASLSVTGDITGGSLTVNGATSINGTTNINGDMVATGKVQGSSITDGTATLQGGNLTNVGSIEAATVTTTGNATIGGDLKVDGEFNAGTLASRVDANNFTEISGGKVHSKNFNAGPEQLTSESKFDENGRSEYARDDESISTSVLSADEISQKIADVGDNPQAYAERAVKQGTDNKYSMADTVKDGAKTNVASQSATESSDVVTDDDGNTSTFRQKVDALLQEIKNAAGTESSSVEQKLDNITSTVTDGTNTTSTEQTTTDITNKAENGTITNTAKDLVNTATENMTNTVGKDLTTTVGGNMATTVTGNQTNDITGDQTNTIGGNKSETVTGTSEETVTGKKTETYNGGLETTVTGEEKHTVNGDQTTTVTGNQANDITGDQTNTIGGDQSTEVAGDSNLEANNITNEAAVSIKDKVGTTTVTTTDGKTKLTNDAGEHRTEMDYADVLKDLGVRGNATVDKDLSVGGNAAVTGTLDVTGKTTLNETEVKGTATFRENVTMDKDLSVGGNATVAGDVTAKSYKVGDKTYIDENGINANNQKITNVAPGELSANSTDAVNGAQLYQTNQRFDRLETRVDKVGANAAAMANLHPLDFDEDSKLSVAASLGNYRSETAGAVGLFYRPVDNVMFNVSTSFGNGENLVGGGVTFKLDRKPARVSKQDRADLVRHIEMLETRLDAFYSVFNPDMSKEFPDVAANHWAYEAVTKLAGNGIIQGFEDGKYHGDRTMTRYEMAEIIYNALMEGKKADAELVEEFKPELQAMAARYNAKTK